MKPGKPLRRTPLQPGTPLHRNVGLARTGSLQANSAPGRYATRKPPRPTGPTPDEVDVVLERDHWSCVVGGEGLVGERGEDWSVHHRKLRSQGGDNSPPNLISACGSGTTGCHGAIHARPEWARTFGGWMLRRSDDPASSPVLIESGARWVLLTATGGTTNTTAPAGWSADPSDEIED